VSDVALPHARRLPTDVKGHQVPSHRLHRGDPPRCQVGLTARSLTAADIDADRLVRRCAPRGHACQVRGRACIEPRADVIACGCERAGRSGNSSERQGVCTGGQDIYRRSWNGPRRGRTGDGCENRPCEPHIPPEGRAYQHAQIGERCRHIRGVGSRDRQGALIESLDLNRLGPPHGMGGAIGLQSRAALIHRMPVGTNANRRISRGVEYRPGSGNKHLCAAESDDPPARRRRGPGDRPRGCRCPRRRYAGRPRGEHEQRDAKAGGAKHRSRGSVFHGFQVRFSPLDDTTFRLLDLYRPSRRAANEAVGPGQAQAHRAKVGAEPAGGGCSRVRNRKGHCDCSSP
jgi:hypothetical protein